MLQLSFKTAVLSYDCQRLIPHNGIKADFIHVHSVKYIFILLLQFSITYKRWNLKGCYHEHHCKNSRVQKHISILVIQPGAQDPA